MYATHQLPGSALLKKTRVLACLCLKSIIFTLLLLLTLRLMCCQAPPLRSGTALLLLLLAALSGWLAVVWDSTSSPVHLLLSFLPFPLSPSWMSAAPVHEVRSSPLGRLKLNMYEVEISSITGCSVILFLLAVKSFINVYLQPFWGGLQSLRSFC